MECGSFEMYFHFSWLLNTIIKEPHKNMQFLKPSNYWLSIQTFAFESNQFLGF